MTIIVALAASAQGIALEVSPLADNQVREQR